MTAPARSPYEMLHKEVDAIGQHCRATAEFAAPLSVIAAQLLRRAAEHADEAGRIADRLERDAAAGGEVDP